MFYNGPIFGGGGAGGPGQMPLSFDLSGLGSNSTFLNDIQGAAPLSFGGIGAPGAVAGPAGSGFLDQIGGLEGLGAIAQGLASLGGVYGSIRGLGMAKDQFNFTKKAYNTNLRNSTRAYNTSLEDRIRSRYHTEGRAAGDVQSYLDKHSL